MTQDELRKRLDEIREWCDPLAVQAVSAVSDRLSKDGKLYGYDGIEAAREIRDTFANAILSDRAELESENKRLREALGGIKQH